VQRGSQDQKDFQGTDDAEPLDDGAGLLQMGTSGALHFDKAGYGLEVMDASTGELREGPKVKSIWDAPTLGVRSTNPNFRIQSGAEPSGTAGPLPLPADRAGCGRYRRPHRNICRFGGSRRHVERRTQPAFERSPSAWPRSRTPISPSRSSYSTIGDLYADSYRRNPHEQSRKNSLHCPGVLRGQQASLSALHPANPTPAALIVEACWSEHQHQVRVMDW
jgi:hypothetical protein